MMVRISQAPSQAEAVAPSAMPRAPGQAFCIQALANAPSATPARSRRRPSIAAIRAKPAAGQNGEIFTTDSPKIMPRRASRK